MVLEVNAKERQFGLGRKGLVVSGCGKEILPDSSNSIPRDLRGETLAGVVGIKLETYDMAKQRRVIFVD